jgi:biotin carboxyl carrier protein
MGSPHSKYSGMEEKSDKSHYSALIIDEGIYQTILTRKYTLRKAYVPNNPKIIRAVIPGTVRKLLIKKKGKIKKGDPILILDAMKMNNQIISPFNGVIKDVFVKDGDMVGKNQPLLEFK